jgi:hypothetical protein
MTGSGNIFRILRRRRASLGRFILVLFAFTAASAGAAPCFSMSRSDASAHHDVNDVASVTSHEHSQAVRHDHSATANQPHGSHSPCPHCPVGAAMSDDASSSSHAFCSASDDASDSTKPSWSPPTVKHLLSTGLIQLLPVDPRPKLRAARLPPPDTACSSVPLNLRNCVFLI